MVKITQSSWFDYSKERILEWMTVAPFSVTHSETPTLLYSFPAGITKSALVHYTLFCGARRLQWTGMVSSCDENEVTVRLNEGPFRGFSATHSFKRDGALTLCDDTLDFQGETEELHQKLESATVVYNLDSRAHTFETVLKIQKERQTGKFEAIRDGAAFSG